MGPRFRQVELRASIDVLGSVPQRHRLTQPKRRLRRRRRVSSITAGRAPMHVGEQGGIRLAHADQHIAAVLGRNHHDIDAAQRLGGRAQVLGGQHRAIGADDEGGSTRGRERRQHARAEIAVGLARERDLEPRLDRREGRVAFIRRGPQRHRADRRRSRRGLDSALDQACLQGGGAVGAEHRDEPGLGKARDRRLGEDRDRDRLNRGHSRIAAPARRVGAEEIGKPQPPHQEHGADDAVLLPAPAGGDDPFTQAKRRGRAA